MTHEEVKASFLNFLIIEHGGSSVEADSVKSLQQTCGFGDINRRCFWRAVRSLAYKPGAQRISLQRPRNLDGSRGVRVGLL